MIEKSEAEPTLLEAMAFDASDVGSFGWDPAHNADLLTLSNDGRTIEWGAKKPEYAGVAYPPAWVPASTRMRLHSGSFRWDFVIDEMAEAQIGIGFMLLWDVGPDWGFFGYLGSSNTAWSYDPSTGDVVCDTRSIQGGLPSLADRGSGVVSVELEVPRLQEGRARFVVDGVRSRDVLLPRGAVVLPAACFLAETQRVTLANLTRS